MSRASPAAAFATGDDPMQPVNPSGQIDGTQQRLAAQKPDPTGDVEEKLNALRREPLILGRRSKPDMLRPSTVPRCKAPHQMRAFRQQQPVQMRSAFDQRPEPVARSAQAVSPLEHVRHRCAEDAHSPPGARRGALPTQRLLPSGVAQKAPRRLCSPHTVTGPLRPDLGVAVVAGRGDLRTTPPRVERVIRPFDGRVLRHEMCRSRSAPVNAQVRAVFNRTSQQGVPKCMRGVPQNAENGRVAERTMKARPVRHDARIPGTFVQDHRWTIRVHRGRIVEAVDLRTGIMECPCPGPGYRPGTGHQPHRSARTRRKGPGEIQQPHRVLRFESDQPRVLVPAIHDAGFLKDFREARDRIIGSVQHGPVLSSGFIPDLMVEARVNGSNVSKIFPSGGMESAAEVDPPDH